MCVSDKFLSFTLNLNPFLGVKMDKASVLGDAIKYLKQLQDKVVNLEDQVAKRSIESAVLVKKTQLLVDGEGEGDEDYDDEDDDTSSSDGNSEEDHRRRSGSLLPEIEARVCDKSILIKIHCENRKGVLVQALSEIEKLHLSVMNTSVMAFTSNSLDITVASQASLSLVVFCFVLFRSEIDFFNVHNLLTRS